MLSQHHSFKKIFFAIILLAIGTTATARDFPDFTKLVENSGQAVVNISTLKKARTSDNAKQIFEEFEGTPFYDLFRHFWGGQNGNGPNFGQPRDMRSLGSGFIVKSDGYIITNGHVIDGADEILVRLNDRRELEAELIGIDKGSDIAVLKIKANDLPVLELATDEETKVGEWVLAIGSPFGFDHSVTAGIVSATGRSFGQERYVPFIQTDVAINPGNSGGPLLNLDGKVVGINSHIVTRSGQYGGLSFAIPSSIVNNVFEQIVKSGKVARGWLGLMFQEVNRELAESFGLKKPEGALVAKVLQDSPAEKAGIKSGDVIIKFNKIDIERSGDLPPLVGSVTPGDVVPLTVVRNGKVKKIDVMIGELPEEETIIASNEPTAGSGNKLGILVRELSATEKSRLGPEAVGVLVEKMSGGVAFRAGLRPGDVILSIDHKPITSKSDFNKRLEKLKDGDIVPLLVLRPNVGQRYIAIKISDNS